MSGLWVVGGFVVDGFELGVLCSGWTWSGWGLGVGGLFGLLVGFGFLVGLWLFQKGLWQLWPLGGPVLVVDG